MPTSPRPHTRSSKGAENCCRAGSGRTCKVTGAETILYIAGQVAYDDNGNVAHAGDFKGQARATLQALKAQVEAGGGTMANIVKVNTYLTDIRHRADYAAIREEF